MGDGDRGFADFVSAEHGALLRLAVLLSGDRGHAEDLVQTALLKTYRHWDRISRSGPPSAYVRRVLVTTHTSWRRRLSATEQVMETLPERHGLPPVERDDDMVRALRQLPPRMRAAVVLRYYEDLSEAQTAEVMGCSVGTVKTQTSRAMARLRLLLDDPAPARAEGRR